MDGSIIGEVERAHEGTSASEGAEISEGIGTIGAGEGEPEHAGTIGADEGEPERMGTIGADEVDGARDARES